MKFLNSGDSLIVTINLCELTVEAVQQLAFDVDDEDALDKIANYPDGLSRIRIARRTTKLSTLERLATDENPEVRKAVIQNEATPKWLIEKIAKNDSNYIIRNLCKEIMKSQR